MLSVAIDCENILLDIFMHCMPFPFCVIDIYNIVASAQSQTHFTSKIRVELTTTRC